MNKNILRLLIVVIPVLIVFVLGYFVALPKMEKAGEIEETLDSKRLELSIEEVQLESLSSMDNVSLLKKEKDELKKALPSDISDTELLSEIEELYLQYELSVSNISIRSSEAESEGELTEYPIEITGEATTASLENFIEGLQNSDRLVVINSLLLTREVEEGVSEMFAFTIEGSIFSS